ncbi:MAG TPA: AlpA family transcriptional regulator [Morganella sp. (in: Bacteria)]|nr:AlpA family transcriptional regulator [Morganella sp. (in: enterobacteria)]
MIAILTRGELEDLDGIDRLIKIEECEWLTSLNSQYLRKLENNGEFPPRVMIGPKTKLHRLSEVQDWIKGTWKSE